MGFLASLGGRQKVVPSQSESSQTPGHLSRPIPWSLDRCRGGAKQSSWEQEDHTGLKIRISVLGDLCPDASSLLPKGPVSPAEHWGDISSFPPP